MLLRWSNKHNTGNIHRYLAVFVLVDIFCCSDTQYSTNQRAVSTVHMPVNYYLVALLTWTLTNRFSGHHADMILFIKPNHWHHRRVLGFFMTIAMLYASIGIGIWYRQRPILLGIGYWVPWAVPRYAHAPFSPKNFNGLLFTWTLCMCRPNLKFIALPVPEIIAIGGLGGVRTPIVGKGRL